MARYEPPTQPRFAQILDVIFLIVAIFVALWLPLQLGFAGVSKALDVIENPTWEKLSQNPTMVSIWEKLGYTPATAHDIIQNKFHYTVNWPQLIIMIVVVVGYFLFLFRASEKEYREVIDEKFGANPESKP